MGKTIQIASLIHTVRGADDSRESSHVPKPKMRQLAIDKAFKAKMVSKFGNSACRVTLVIAPTSLLSQWASELQRASKQGTLSVMVWHGSNRANLEADIDGLDVLITSYGVLVSEFTRNESSKSTYRSPLFESENSIQISHLSTDQYSQLFGSALVCKKEAILKCLMVDPCSSR
jgi:DNA repair protein RAD5